MEEIYSKIIWDVFAHVWKQKNFVSVIIKREENTKTKRSTVALQQ